jgi:mono/diheme cytochrome c family protein
MSKTLIAVVLVGVLAIAYWLFAPPRVPDVPIPGTPAAIERGRYLVAAGGCVSCHEGTEHPETLSGGRALESPFGTFHVPNITPHVETGIGGWTGADFLKALKHGRSPHGGFFFPAFPYRAYAGMTDEDVLDMAAYLVSLPTVEFRTPPHQLEWWLQRWMVAGWNRLADLLQPALPMEADAQVARGAYLARHLGHCGECHTPRNSLGIPDLDREFGGGMLGDDEVEAIDADALAEWSADDFMLLLNLGLKADGEFVGGEMEAVVEHNTSQLTTDDQRALAAFFTRQRAD